MYALIKIDVTKINKDWLFQGKNGRKYLDVIVKDAKDNNYGDQYMVTQAVPKAERDKGTKYGPILGSGKDLGKGFSPRTPANAPAKRQTQSPGSPVITDDSDQVPF